MPLINILNVIPALCYCNRYLIDHQRKRWEAKQEVEGKEKFSGSRPFSIQLQDSTFLSIVRLLDGLLSTPDRVKAYEDGIVVLLDIIAANFSKMNKDAASLIQKNILKDIRDTLQRILQDNKSGSDVIHITENIQQGALIACQTGFDALYASPADISGLIKALVSTISNSSSLSSAGVSDIQLNMLVLLVDHLSMKKRDPQFLRIVTPELDSNVESTLLFRLMDLSATCTERSVELLMENNDSGRNELYEALQYSVLNLLKRYQLLLLSDKVVMDNLKHILSFVHSLTQRCESLCRHVAEKVSVYIIYHSTT